MTAAALTRARPWILPVATAVAVAAYDARAPAADPKRVLGLLVAVVGLASTIAPVGERAAGGGTRGGEGIEAKPSGPVLAFLVFVGWSAVTLFWGVPAGIRDLAAWTAAAGLAVAVSTVHAGEVQPVAERAAALAGTAAAALAVVERLGGARGLFVHGGQGNANWLGLLLALTLPLSLGFAARFRGAARAPVLVAVAIQGVGLVLSHSRVAWAASAVAAVLGLVLARRAAAIRAAAALTLAVAVAFSLSVPAPARAAPTHAAAAHVEGGEDVSVPIAWKGRVWIWRTAADAAVASLPLGAGLGGFAHAYLDAQGRRLTPLDPKAASHAFLNATTAHDDWLEVLVDAGPPALLLLALALGGGVLAAVHTGWSGGAAALAATCVCATGDSPLRQPGLVLLLGLVLAGAGDAQRRAAPDRRPAALRFGLLIASAWLLAVAVGVWLGNRRLTAAQEAPPEARAALLASAARLDPRSGEIALERGLLAVEAGDAEGAVAHLRRARALLANVGTDVALGNALFLLGRNEEAMEAYEAALRRNPGSFRAHANATQPLLALGRLDTAERHLATASALWPGHPRLAEMAEQLRRSRIDQATGR